MCIRDSYRAFVARKTVEEKKLSKQPIVIQNQSVGEDDETQEVTLAATKIQASFRAKKARNHVKEMQEESAAATKVQSSFRAKKARDEVKAMREAKG